MRTRTLLAGATLALLTMAWSAPGAMAADNDGSGSQPPSSSVPVPGSADSNKQADKPKPSEEPAPPAPPKPVEPKPAEPKPSAPEGRPIAPGEPAPGQVKPGPILSDPKATLSVSPDLVSPGDTITANANCANGQQVSLTGDGVRFDGNRGTVDRNANSGGHTVTLICGNGPKQDRATATFQVRGIAPGGPGSPGWPGGPGRPGDGDLRATLSVSPRTVRQGDIVTFNGGCSRGQQVDLRADDVNVRGDRGYVDDNAREGDHTATRVCRDGGRQETATDHFRVIRDDDNHGPGGSTDPGPRDLWLSDRSGYRGDEVDVSVRCRDNSARLEADGLNDITLRRDGSRLTGTTHVEDRADPGWHRVTVSCDGHSDSVGFRVLRDRGDHDRYLHVDPGYGHRGDEVDIHVGCDWSVGRVESDALDDIDVDRDGRDWRYEGTTHVSDDADPGEHTVRVSCGNDTLEESFFVQGDGDHNGDDDSSEPGGGEYVSVYPVGAPETGGGPVDDGGSRGLTALGVLGLTGAVIAGTGATLARRNSRRGAER
jgi:hypothetical protein